MARHETPGRTKLRIKVTAGSVLIESGEAGAIEAFVKPRRDSEASRRLLEEVTERVQEVRPGEYELELEVPSGSHSRWFGVFQTNPGFDVHVRAPEGSDVDVEVVSADVVGRGTLGPVRARSISGDLSFDQCSGSAALKTVSGDIDAGSIGGSARVQTISGDVTIDWITGELTGKTVSGDFEVGAVGGSARVTSISGDVDIASVARGEVHVKTTSGDINVGIERGVAIWMDVSSRSGDTTSYLEGGEEAGGDVQLEVRANSISGDVTLRTATASDPEPGKVPA